MAVEINASAPVTKSGQLTTVSLANAASATELSGFGGEDTLSVPNGRVTGAVIRGDDVVLKTSIGVDIRVKNAKGHYLHVQDDDGYHYQTYGGSYSYRPLDVIKSFMSALDNTTLQGAAALDQAVQACSSKFSSIQDAVAQCVADCKDAPDAQTFLRKYCGIELTDYDTGAITGWDAANYSTKTNESVVPESGSLQTFNGKSFTVNGLTLNIPSNLTSTQQTIINGLYTWWTKEGLNLITESYGNNYSFTSSGSATVKEMNVEFVNSKQNFLALVRYSYDTKSGKSVALTMQINMHYYNSLTADNVNGESSNKSAGYLDRTLAHEFTHAVMAANIDHFGKLPNFISEGMAELTHGIDDHRYNDILSLAGSSSKLSKNLNVKDTKSSTSSIYAAGYIFLRYLAKQSAVFTKNYVETFDWDDPPEADDMTDGVSYSDSKRTKLLVNNFTGLVDAANFSSKVVTVDASDDNQLVALVGNKAANVLRAGSGGTSMNGGLGADKLYGGAGGDTYSYSVGGGNDVFYNFNGADGDIVQIFGDNSISASSFKESGKNIILTVGSGKTKGTITFNAPEGRITVVDANGRTLATFHEPLPDGLATDTKKTKLTIGAGAALSAGSTVAANDYATTIKEIDASAFDKTINLVGNTQANILRAGTKGGVLDGGLGADKLYGGSGGDTYSYSVGGGNDTIYNFNGAEGDVVRLSGVDTIGASSFKESGKNIILTVGSGKTKGTVTFNDPNGRITVVDANGRTLTTFNEPLPDGLATDTKKTKLTVGASAALSAGSTVAANDYATTIKEIDASAFDRTINLVGNTQANVLRAGTKGGVLDGGLGADKLYGGSGGDTYSYSVGGGNDTIYNFNGVEGDVVRLSGVETIGASSFKESGKNIILTVGSGKTKGTVTFNDPNGRITVVDANGRTLTTFHEPLPDGLTTDTKKTKLTVGAGAALNAGSTVAANDYATTIKEIDASAFDRTINLVGNTQANVLRAGTKGGVLDGGLGADKLYGGSGGDTYSYSVGGGNDTIYNFNGVEGDVVRLSGVETIGASSFKESGKNIVLTVGSGKTKGTVTFNDPNGRITVVDANGRTLTTFNEPLPAGIEYNKTKTQVIFSSDANLVSGATFDLTKYSPAVKDVNAAQFDGRIALTGNANANNITIGGGGGTLDGGAGNDKLYGGAGRDVFVYADGAGNDTVTNYESDDSVVIEGTVKSSSVSGKNVVLKVGKGSLTLTNVVDKVIELNIDGSSGLYKFNKNNNTLEKASANASSNAQQPATEYWFEFDEPINNELGDIVEVKALGLEERLSTELELKAEDVGVIQGSAASSRLPRSRQTRG